MTERLPTAPPAARRRRVIAVFFTGLAGLALLAAAVGWGCDWRLGWLPFDWGGLQLVLGAGLGVGGLALVIWSVAVQYTLGQGTPAPAVATRHLVTQGPYACTRNPMTLGALGLYLGIGLGLGAGTVVALTAVVFSLLLTFIYVHETRELTERFGDRYRDYRRRTPFLIPRCR